MKLVYILILAVVIIIVSIMRAFGVVIGDGGGNLPRIISQAQKMLRKPEQNSDQIEEDEDIQNKSASQIYRTIAGMVFSILLLYPIIFLGRRPAIDISSEWRIILFISLIFLLIVLFLVIQKKDRDYQRNIHIDDEKTPKA